MKKLSANFAFSLENVKNIPFYEYENDFIFIVDNKCYETNRYIADLLSPIIRKYHYDDKTFDRFTISTSKNIQNIESSQNKKDNYFLDFLKLVTFENFEINDDQLIHFAEYFLQLGNIDEFLRLKSEYFENLTPQNVIDRLNFIFKCIKTSNEQSILYDKFVTSDQMAKIISFAASHFTEIDKNELKKLNEELFEEIIRNDSLKLNEEDDLLQIILDLYEKDQKYSQLFEYVIFENISDTTFSMFIEKISIDDLNSQTWHSICQRIQNPLKNPENKSNRYNFKLIKIEYKNDKEFNGILNYLNKETGGNIHQNGTIEITSNSIISSDRHPRNLLNFHDSSLFHSKDENNVEICFDFKSKKVKIENYSIKTYMCGTNTNHMKNWIVDASNDGLNWKTIDYHENDPTLNKANFVATFNVKNSIGFYRFIRLRQTGPNWMNKNFVILHSIEFYGEIKCK